MPFITTLYLWVDQNDWPFLQETHDDGERGRHLQLLLSETHKCFWNPLDASRHAGGTALLIKKRLLQFFDDHFVPFSL